MKGIRYGKTNALHYAVSAGSLNLVKCLLEAGTDIYAVDWNGNTPLEGAFHSARGFELIKLEPVTRYLLSQKISVTEKLQKYMREVAEDIEFRRKDMKYLIMAELTGIRIIGH